MQTENTNWNEWKFQIHQNKFEWLNPRDPNEQKNPFCVSSNFLCLKDDNKTAHWVDHQKLKSQIHNILQNKKAIDDIKSSLTGTTI